MASVEHFRNLYREMEEVKVEGEEERTSKTRIKDLSALCPEIGTRSILTQYLKSAG